MVGTGTAVGEVVADRIIKLETDESEPFGVLTDVPEGYDSASAYVEHIRETTHNFYGAAGELFLQNLVEERSGDEALLRSRIEREIQSFRQHADVDPNMGAELRDADVFGLVHAAGVLAKTYGILPPSWKNGPAILSCYARYRRRQLPSAPFAEQLLQIAARPDVVVLGATPKPTPDLIEDAMLFRTKRAGKRRLIMRLQAKTEHLPAWHGTQPPAALAPYIIKDGDHWTINQRLGEKRERVYAFVLPEKQTK